MSKESEFRLYNYIKDRLDELGWDTKSPSRNGQMYVQNEPLHDPDLKKALGRDRPENILLLGQKRYWVIEAKADLNQLKIAIDESKTRAEKINGVPGLSCRIITGVAGSPDTTHSVETHCLVGQAWKPLFINNRQSTGFISPEQIEEILASDTGKLDRYEVDDDLFLKKTSQINKILHDGAINKRNRAAVLACLLLALANDQQMLPNSDPATLIKDINSRAEAELEKYGKQNFFEEIKIHLPTSKSNHTKNKIALTKSIEVLRDLNIASAIDSGRDILGQCYEQFLKYANDAKEIGVVLTPRHITNFGAEILNVRMQDIVFDPTCGTGGFLVSALDKVRRDGGDVDRFKRGNLHGVEQDALIATLAIVNMVFRGDGSSNIVEGDVLNTKIPVTAHKVLMNPPFAGEYEWKFVDRGLDSLHKGGRLFAVLPTTCLASANDSRREITWRSNLLKRHKLIAVIKLPEPLFYPHVSKGTYGVVIEAHIPHKPEDKVLWGFLYDGESRTKTQKQLRNNMCEMTESIRRFVDTGTEPTYKNGELDCSQIIPSKDVFDLSPEYHIGRTRSEGLFDIYSVQRSISEGELLLDMKQKYSKSPIDIAECNQFKIISFFKSIERGKSGRNISLGKGDLPLVTTSEKNNGISNMVNEKNCAKVYGAGTITISANGGSCRAHFHEYEFAANGDVYVCVLKPEFTERYFGLFLCSAINGESWRFNYYNKFSKSKLEQCQIKIPVTDNGEIDFEGIRKIIDKELA